MTTCENCKTEIQASRDSFYNEAITAMKESRIGVLPDEIFNNILESVFPGDVTIQFVFKSRCDCDYCIFGSDDENDDNDDEDSDESSGIPCDGLGYLYNDASSLMCSKCFLEGIQRVYGTSGELPYMRYHVHAFFNKIPITVSPYKYQLPRTYNITFYRRKQPVRHKNALYITNE